MQNTQNKLITLAKLSALPALFAAGTASAAVDYTSITGAFTAADVVTGVMAVAGTLATIFVSIRGATTVLGLINGKKSG